MARCTYQCKHCRTYSDSRITTLFFLMKSSTSYTNCVISSIARVTSTVRSFYPHLFCAITADQKTRCLRKKVHSGLKKRTLYIQSDLCGKYKSLKVVITWSTVYYSAAVKSDITAEDIQ